MRIAVTIALILFLGSHAQADNVDLYRLQLRGESQEVLHQAILQQGIGTYRAPNWLRERAGGSVVQWRVEALNGEGQVVELTEWRALRFP